MRIHIDVSVKYNQRGDSAIGFVNDKQKPLFAIILREDIKKKLQRKYPAIQQDINLFHAIILYLLLKDKIRKLRITSAVICADYNPYKVIPHLEGLLAQKTKLLPIDEWRAEIKDSKADSLAHGFVKKLALHASKRNNIYRIHKLFKEVDIIFIDYYELEVLVKKMFFEK